MSDKNRETIEEKIRALSRKYSNDLKAKIDKRLEEIKSDDRSHHLIYRVLGIAGKEGDLIDQYQNKGRFLYRYAGAFLEEATILCFEEKFPQVRRKVRIENKTGRRPKTFEIDCLVENEAFEIKWRDATTDGDHITKEHARVQNIKEHDYRPIRIMFYYPNRDRAIRIQETLKTIYQGMNGEYYSGDQAWKYVKSKTQVNLLEILEKIADEKTK